MANRLIVIGMGGIGTCLFPVLYKFLAYDREQWHVVLIDGDHYTQDNVERQFFPEEAIGQNKAAVCEKFYQQLFPQLTFSSYRSYINRNNLIQILEGDVVMLCVDNHQTRKMVSDRCERLDDIVLISGGNALYTGDVTLYVKTDGNAICSPLASKYNPTILHPTDRHPQDIGCDEDVEHASQLVTTNNVVAAAMISMLEIVLGEEEITYSTQYIDRLTGNSRGVFRKR